MTEREREIKQTARATDSETENETARQRETVRARDSETGKETEIERMR